MKLSTVLQVVAGLIITTVGIVVFTRQVELATVGAIMKGTAPWKIGAVILLNFFTLFFRALRWKVLLPNKADAKKSELFPLVTIGFMVNNFIPFRIGEAVRALLLWKRNGFSISESISSIVLERLLDVMVYGTFLCLPLFFLPQLEGHRMYAYLLLAGVSFALCGFLVYALFPSVIAAIGTFLVRFVPAAIRAPLTSIAREALSNLSWLFSGKKIVLVTLLSYVTLFCQVGMLSILGLGNKMVTGLVSMFGVAFAAIGAAIPLAPGYVGTLHAMVLKGLGMAGVPADTAGALVIMYHAIGYSTISVLGLFFFFKLKVTFADLRSAVNLKKK